MSKYVEKIFEMSTISYRTFFIIVTDQRGYYLFTSQIRSMIVRGDQ
jgi:hypothetical protein